MKDYTGTRPSRSGISAPIEATHPITNSYREQIHGPSRFGCNSEDILAELQYRITCHERMPRSLRLWKLSSAPRAVHREPFKSVTTARGFELNSIWIFGQCFQWITLHSLGLGKLSSALDQSARINSSAGGRKRVTTVMKCRFNL